jgi:hypothetical protein
MTADLRYQLKLALVVSCTTCNVPRPVKGPGNCPVCGVALPDEHAATVRAAVRRRRTMFKGRLVRLDEQMRQMTDAKLPFKKRGTPLSVGDHLKDVLRPALDALAVRGATLRELFATGTWDPDEAGCIELFSRLVGALTDGLAAVEQLRNTMPPLEWRSVHRELVRATTQQLRGQITMAMTIIAPDADEAVRLQTEAIRALDQGAHHAARADALIERIRHLPSDGPFQLDGSLDVAALAWSSTGESGQSIAASAQLVREAFADIPDVSTLADEHAVILLTLLASTAQQVDHELLIQRAIQLRNVLDAADSTSPWIVEPDLLAARMDHGLDRILEEAERLGLHIQYGLPRREFMRTLSEAYRQLVEGAMRDLGGAILIASRANHGEDNWTYEYAVVEGVQAGEVVSEFERIGGPCGQAIDMLYRNASAHADFTVTNTGIFARQRRIENGRLKPGDPPTVLSDAEFFEEYVALQEVLLALELAVLPWLWTHANPGLASALAALPVSETQRNRPIALIAGMAGLHQVVVAEDGDHATVTATAHASSDAQREVGYLTVIPAVFGAMPQVSSATLTITGRQPVAFERSEFTDSSADDSPHALPLLGLTTAKWHLASGAPWSDRDEAAYVAFPLTMLHFGCMRLAGHTPQAVENVEQAVASLRLYRGRLDGVLPEERRSALMHRIVDQANLLTESLAGLAEVLRGRRNSQDAQRLATVAAATTESVFQLQEEAKALRDAALPGPSMTS